MTRRLIVIRVVDIAMIAALGIIVTGLAGTQSGLDLSPSAGESASTPPPSRSGAGGLTGRAVSPITRSFRS
jgi:hypothetical protein